MIKKYLMSVLLCSTIHIAAHQYPGFLCSIEGIDGAGKSSLIKNLQAKFVSSNFPAVFTKEPGSTALGKYLRSILNDRLCATTIKAESLLFAADRAQHFEEFVIPHLRLGDIVISDRMADSAVVYQGYLKGLDINMINMINTWCMQNIPPDLVIYLRIEPADARERIEQARGFINTFEQEFIDKLQILFEAFEDLFKGRENVFVVDAMLDENTIADIVFNEIVLRKKSKV